METQSNGRAMKMVYTVIERAPGKTFWTRVGVGSVNRDGSLGLRLDAIPISGVLQVRDWEPRDDAPGTAKAPDSPRPRATELSPEPLF
jgi:hypothetical protein